MRTFHLLSLSAVVMVTGLAVGVSQASADAPTSAQLMNGNYGGITLSNGSYNSAGDPNAIIQGPAYTMSYLTSTPGRWGGYDVSAVVTQFKQNGTNMSQLWLVDSSMRPFGGAIIHGNVEAAVVSMVNGIATVNYGIRNADGSLSQASASYDLVVGELKLVAPTIGPAPTTPAASIPAASGAGTDTGTGVAPQATQVVPAAAGNAGMLPIGTPLGLELALASTLGAALIGARRMGRQS